MAAVLVVLAGGANALANTVWTVSKTSSNATCSASATTCNTIGSAVSAASSGDVIVVGPGTYNESVSITTYNLSIFGAQAGKDARAGRYGPAGESVVDATNQSNGPGLGAAFYVDADNVLIDGFTIQGGTLGDNASGIYVDSEDAAQILDNIVENNSVGVYLYRGSYHLIQHNLFATNNKAPVGMGVNVSIIPGPGFGLAANDASADSITENASEGNLGAAMFIYDATAMEINNNTSMDDGSFVIIDNCDNTFFDHNQGQHFGANGFLPVYSTTNADAAVDILYYNYGIQINDNVLEDARTPGYNAIAFSNMTTTDGAPDGVCEYCQVSYNTIKRFAGNGIVAEPYDSDETLYYSLISGNDVEDNGNVGILIGLAPENYDNTLFHNTALFNQTNDCEDDTGPGNPLTLGTNNTWFNNIGSLSSPAGLCTRPGRVMSPLERD
jgi:parallel beta-helix repeat protein